MAVDEKVLQEKLDKGTALTPEEEKYLLSDEPPVTGFKEALPEVDKATEQPKEEAPAETDKAGEKKKETPAVEEKPEDVNDPFVKIERELAKPEGKEDLKDFSAREKAYYYQMRRDRKSRQKAEEERDAALFNLSKAKKEPEKKEESPEPDPLDELKKKDPTDFMTVADVLKVVESVGKKKEELKKEDAPSGKVDPVRMRFLKMCESEARTQFPEDYDAVMELTEDIMMTNEKYLVEVAKAMNAGENPAIKSYELIKADPEFANLFPVAKTKVEARKQAGKAPEKKDEAKPAKTAEEVEKEKRALAAQEALDKNKDKKKTTGHVETGSGKEETEVSMEEISKMSDRQFAKLPKKTRDAYLQKYG